MSVSPDPYEPKYTSVEAVPTTGPDPWTDAEKLDKIEDAESKLESDVNRGATIPPENRTHLHGAAAAAWASYLLALGPKSPDSMLAGDFADEGSRREELHDHLKSIYQEYVKSLVDDDGGDDSVTTPNERNPYIYKID